MGGTSQMATALAFVCLLAPAVVQADSQDDEESSLLPVDLFGAEEPSAPQVIYRYRNAEGRTVYTNFEDTVPPTQRADAEVDLSHITLNTEIGSEIDARLKEQHAELIHSGYCKNLRDAANTSALQYLWDEYAPLIVCGGMLLLFIFFTPAALRRVGAPVWAKTLTMAIPALAVAGLVMFGMTQANRMVTDVKRKVSPCVEETWDRISARPQPVANHARLVQHLQQQIKGMEGLTVTQGIDGLQGLQDR